MHQKNGDKLDCTFARLKEISIDVAPTLTTEATNVPPVNVNIGILKLETDSTVGDANMIDLEDITTYSGPIESVETDVIRRSR
jgi:hypothetical protein